MKEGLKQIYKGIVTDNPVLVLMLGMCPTLAVTKSAVDGVGMGLSTMVVLILSNMMISALRKVIPDGVRMPAYIVIVASFVTIVEFVLKAYVYSLYESLGVYIPLIVVNCIILGRAESYASKNNVFLSMCDGIGMGLGFTVALGLLGLFRELLGAGTMFGINILRENACFEPIAILVQAPGAFFVVAALAAVQNKLGLKSATNTRGKTKAGCNHDCLHCGGCMAAADVQEKKGGAGA